MMFEDSEIKTSSRGKLYAMKNDKKVYVFQDPINLNYYDLAQGALLDTKRYHKKTLTDYLMSVNFDQVVVPHSRRPLERDELLEISSKVYNYWFNYFPNENATSVEANITRANDSDEEINSGPTETVAQQVDDYILRRSDRAARNNRRFPRQFTVEIPENVLAAMSIVNQWYADIADDLQL